MNSCNFCKKFSKLRTSDEKVQYPNQQNRIIPPLFFPVHEARLEAAVDYFSDLFRSRVLPQSLWRWSLRQKLKLKHCRYESSHLKDRYAASEVWCSAPCGSSDQGPRPEAIVEAEDCGPKLQRETIETEPGIKKSSPTASLFWCYVTMFAAIDVISSHSLSSCQTWLHAIYMWLLINYPLWERIHRTLCCKTRSERNLCQWNLIFVCKWLSDDKEYSVKSLRLILKWSLSSFIWEKWWFASHRPKSFSGKTIIISFGKLKQLGSCKLRRN